MSCYLPDRYKPETSTAKDTTSTGKDQVEEISTLLNLDLARVLMEWSAQVLYARPRDLDGTNPALFLELLAQRYLTIYPIQNKAICMKCRRTDISTKYHAANTWGSEEVTPEFLIKTCRNCGYIWREECLDTK